MITDITTTPQLIGLAAAGAAALGLSLSDGLLQPMGRLASLRKARRTATTTPVMEETPEHRAALPHVAAPAPAAAPAPRKSAPTTGLLELFGGEEDSDPTTADTDPIIHP